MATANNTTAPLYHVQTSLCALHALAKNFDDGIPDAGFTLAHIVKVLTKNAGESIDGYLKTLGDPGCGWHAGAECEEAAQ